MRMSVAIPLTMPVTSARRIWYDSCRGELGCPREERTMPSFRMLSAADVAVLEQGAISARPG